MRLAEALRDQLPQLKLQVNCGGGSFKSQFKKADKSGAEYAIVIGDDEAARGEIALKPLRADREQLTLDHSQLLQFLRDRHQPKSL